MKSVYKGNIKITIYGESHGKAVGAKIAGLKRGIPISEDDIKRELARRSPNALGTTARKEPDSFKTKGIKNGKTAKKTVTVEIANTDVRDGDYENIKNIPRPSHADYTSYVKYGKDYPHPGGGHLSGRITAPLTAVGAVIKNALARTGITVVSHIYNVGDIYDTPFCHTQIGEELIKKLSQEAFPVIDSAKKEEMTALIKETAENGDSVGGCVEIAVIGMPAGMGEPHFYGVENVLSQLLFSVPAVKAVAFGAGEELSRMTGSAANDGMYFDGDTVKTYTNNCGGICGGITNGMPLIVRATLKPTPSISVPQKTVDLRDKKNTQLCIKGRHDACIALRAAAALEAAAAAAVYDILKGNGYV